MVVVVLLLSRVLSSTTEMTTPMHSGQQWSIPITTTTFMSSPMRFNFVEFCFALIIVMSVLCGVFILGYFTRMSHSQDANDLLTVGYKITDPEGYEIERFETDLQYWTTTHKE